MSGFFFQAEDGIRDLVRSRGLGDVYKRQGIYSVQGHYLDARCCNECRVYDWQSSGQHSTQRRPTHTGWSPEARECSTVRGGSSTEECGRGVEIPNCLATPEDGFRSKRHLCIGCLLYTSDAADDLLCVYLGGRRIIQKKHMCI
eukprot:TRINITY_DN24560_c0_g1_i1.p1 TRINITY_DN24560_c0_g1~~TRINITY_DN24560_c0_g1_i1.p1  ORF type:complete len:144 (-),score=51.59 TRINITY_DN24560_c0_g1_i1:30-461(-)